MPKSTPTTRAFTIVNQGNYPLAISGLVTPANYTVSGASTANIPPSGSFTFEVALASPVIGTFAGDIEIASDDVDENPFTFPVTGRVLDPPGLADVAASAVMADGVSFSATVDPKDSTTTVQFEFSTNSNFEGALEVSTLAGSVAGFRNGCSTEAKFNSPQGIAVGSDTIIYVADTENHRIRRITANGDCGVLAGSTTGYADGIGGAAKFNQPRGVAVGPQGNVYVADSGNHRIRKITPTGIVSTLAGSGNPGFTDGVGTGARFNAPESLAVDAGGTVYVADMNNHRIRVITPGGDVSTLAGSGNGILASGFADGPGANAKFSYPASVALDGAGNVYVADRSNQRIRKVTQAGEVSTLAGSTQGFVDGTGNLAKFSSPAGVAVDRDGNVIVADQSNQRIRRITPGGVVSTLAGSSFPGIDDGDSSIASFSNPSEVALDAEGIAYIVDSFSHRIRRIASTARKVTLPAGYDGTSPIPVSVSVAGLQPDTVYFFRSIATNAGGTTVSGPTQQFQTLPGGPTLSGLTVSAGVLSPSFTPCILNYQVEVGAFIASLVVTPDTQVANNGILVSVNGNLCCTVASGSASDPLPLNYGTNLVEVEILAANGGSNQTYSVEVTRAESPYGAWKDFHFGSDSGNPAIAGDLVDREGDETANLVEYALGLDPNSSDVEGLPTAGRAGGLLTLTYTRVVSATDILYEVVWSDDLEIWSGLGVTEQVLSSDGTTQQILASVPAATDRRRFIKLNVILP